MKGVNLYKARLTGANLNRAKMTPDAQGYVVNLRAANLQDADLGNAELEGANLEGANLTMANLLHSNLQAANLQNAIVTQQQIDSACGDGKTILPDGMKPAKLCPQAEAADLARITEFASSDAVQKMLSTKARELRNWALWLAARAGYLRAMRRLLEAGADIESGNSPLVVAAERGHLEVVEFLLERGANVQAAGSLGWTPLMRASSEGHTDVVRLLVKQGADVTYRNADGETALDLAKWRGHLEVVKVLNGH